jgi:dihydrolipoamide dehydrogenase
VPPSLLIVGGGVIGCEFAHIFSSLGAQVTVVEALDRLLPLPSVDAACSKVLQREMKKRRIRFMTHRTVQAISETQEGLRVVIGPSPFNEAPTAKEKEPVEMFRGHRVDGGGAHAQHRRHRSGTNPGGSG